MQILACKFCLFDTFSDPELTLDSEGKCNYCLSYFTNLYDRTEVLSIEAWLDRIEKLSKKRQNLKSNYDCIIGLSGGIDSAYVAHLISKSSLRVLAVHLDNGWNSSIASSNIEKLVTKLGIDFRTYVIDWNVFREIQKAFLLSDTPDGEIPTDHAIQALLWKTAAKENVGLIFTGMSFRTESPLVPNFWSKGHSDFRYIKGVIRKFSNCDISKYPHFTIRNLLHWTLIKRIRIESPLNYVDFSKSLALEILKTNYGFEEYGAKHHESLYTRFYQGYFLPRKFGIDKRIAHLSDLVRLGQISREEALIELSNPPYSLVEQQDDLEYVKKRLQFSETEFLEILNAPIKNYSHFSNNSELIVILKKILNLFRRLNIYPK
jgi:N-acetyl sugar amidotransferase